MGNNHIKKMLHVTLILILCFANGIQTANAATLVSITELHNEVSSGWYQGYEAHGRTIAIDLGNIAIPEVSAVPVFTVRAADAVPQDRIGPFEERGNMPNSANFSKGGFPHDAFDVPSKMSTLTDRVYTAHNVEWDYCADGNTLSVGGAMDIIRADVRSWFGDAVADGLVLGSMTVGTKMMEYSSSTNQYGAIIDHPANAGSYVADVYQSFHGIPVLYANGGHFGTLKGEDYGLFSSVRAYVYDADNYTFQNALVNEVETKYSDVPLLPFAEIQKSFEQLIMDGRIRSIESLQLGYVLYLDPNDQGINWAVPTWMARAEFYDDASEDAYEEFYEGGQSILMPKMSYVFVQAQTGKIIDPLDQNPSRRDVPQIVSW